jgi:hypothetical protein
LGSYKSALTTSMPFALRAFTESESGLRDTARGVYVPSASTAFNTEEPSPFSPVSVQCALYTGITD